MNILLLFGSPHVFTKLFQQFFSQNFLCCSDFGFPDGFVKKISYLGIFYTVLISIKKNHRLKNSERTHKKCRGNKLVKICLELDILNLIVNTIFDLFMTYSSDSPLNMPVLNSEFAEIFNIESVDFYRLTNESIGSLFF